MDKKLDDLLMRLDEEIDIKCAELKEKRREQHNIRIFAAICVMFVTVPILLVFAGINILAVFFPIVIFLTVSVAVLSPIIINNYSGGPQNEEFLQYDKKD